MGGVMLYSDIIWNGKRKFHNPGRNLELQISEFLVLGQVLAALNVGLSLLCIWRDKPSCAVIPQKPGLFLQVSLCNNP